MARTTDYTKWPIGLKWRSNTLFILSTVGIGLFTDLFLYGLVVPILPYILSDRLNVPHSGIQTYSSVLIACYAGASFAVSIPVGIISDKLQSRQVPFLVGLVALTASSILLYLGKSIGVLILARIFQGISGAIVWTVGLALVLDTVGSEKLGVTIGSIFGFISVGDLIAPVLGGIVYEKAGNGAVFAMGFGLLGVDFMMRLLIIEKKVARRYGLEDVIHQDDEDANREEGVGENTPLLPNGRIQAEDWRITKEQSTIVSKFPILYCFSNSRFLTAQVVAFMQAAVLSSFDATIPTQARDLFGFNSLKVGLLFMPQVIPYLILGPVGGMAVDKYGVKICATLGFAYISIPLFLLRIPHEGGTIETVKFCIFLAMSGVGLAFISAPGIVEASSVLEKYHEHNPEMFGEEGPYAQLYAINSMVFSLGLTLGPMIAGDFKDKIGYGNMEAVVGGLCLMVSGLSLVFLGGKLKIWGK